MTIYLKALEEKAKAATPGPWACISGHFEGHEWFKISSRSLREKHGMTADDANFIAAASPDVVLALIKVVQVYEEALKCISVESIDHYVWGPHGKTTVDSHADEALSLARKILEEA